MTTRFTHDLLVKFRPVKESFKAELMEDLVWEIEYTGKPLPEFLDPEKYIVVPKGFVSDGVTVPRPLWIFFPPWGHPASRAAVLHDFLLENQRNGTPYLNYSSRKKIDDVFYESLKACNVGEISRTLMWIGVRLFSIVYRNDFS